MPKRDSFLLRIDPLVLEAVRRWSDDELRSMNAQIEYILRRQLKEAGRLPDAACPPVPPPVSPPEPSPGDGPIEEGPFEAKS